MTLKNLKVACVVFVTMFFVYQPVQAGSAKSESCIECHLHGSLVKGFTSGGIEVHTLADFHGREFRENELESGCRTCHGNSQNAGKLPGGDVCLGCHTKGNTTQGNPESIFHAEKDHWPMKEVSCTDCHKGHSKGIPEIKFLTTDVVDVCRSCHERSFTLP